MMLTVVITWPDNTPISRDSMVSMLEEVIREPDVAMSAPLQRGDKGQTDWSFNAEARWKVS